MRGRGRCLSAGRGLERQRFTLHAQNRGEAPSPSLRSTSPRTREEVKKSRSRAPLAAPSPRARGEGRDEGAWPLPETQSHALTAQNRGEAPSPSLRSTSPRTRGEVKQSSPVLRLRFF